MTLYLMHCLSVITGRGTQKGGSKMRKSSNSRTGSSTPTTPPPPLVQAPAAAAATAVSAVASPVVEQPAITVAPPTQSKPETDSSAPAAKMEAVDVKVWLLITFYYQHTHFLTLWLTNLYNLLFFGD